MADVLASDVVQDLGGVILWETRWLDDGTVELYEAGALVESRRRTAEETERFAARPASDADRLAALEAQNAALLDALAKVTTVAAVRAAAVEAKERTRLPVSESPSVRDSPRE